MVAPKNGRRATPPPTPIGTRRLIPALEARNDYLGGISKPMFYKLVRNGQLATVHVGRYTYVTSDEIERFIAALENAAAS